MDKRYLKRIKSQARSLVTAETYTNLGPALLEQHIVDTEREILITPLTEVLNTGIEEFSKKGKSVVDSDGWLAPRIHASLRLFRDEAAEAEHWEYLSICIPEIRNYIIWRWDADEGELPTRNRIFGSDRRHSLGRLWWVAELTRNGPDYSSTVEAFNSASQDLINYITDVRAFNNRAAAIGFVKYFASKRSDEEWKAKHSIALGKALNHILTTIVLDGIVLGDMTDMFAYENWVDGHIDETTMIDELPEGPNEPQVSEDQINRIIKLLESLEVHAVQA